MSKKYLVTLLRYTVIVFLLLCVFLNNTMQKVTIAKELGIHFNIATIDNDMVAYWSQYPNRYMTYTVEYQGNLVYELRRNDIITGSRFADQYRIKWAINHINTPFEKLLYIGLIVAIYICWGCIIKCFFEDSNSTDSSALPEEYPFPFKSSL